MKILSGEHRTRARHASHRLAPPAGIPVPLKHSTPAIRRRIGSFIWPPNKVLAHPSSNGKEKHCAFISFACAMKRYRQQASSPTTSTQLSSIVKSFPASKLPSCTQPSVNYRTQILPLHRLPPTYLDFRMSVLRKMDSHPISLEARSESWGVNRVKVPQRTRFAIQIPRSRSRLLVPYRLF